MNALLWGALLFCFTIIIAMDVLYRQILQSPLMWPSEWSLTTFVWSTMLAAAVAASTKSHFVVEVLPKLGRSGEFAISFFVAICGLLTAGMMIWFGWIMAMNGARQFTPMLGNPLIYTYLAFPVFGVLTFFFLFEHLLRAVSGAPDRHQLDLDEIGGE